MLGTQQHPRTARNGIALASIAALAALSLPVAAQSGVAPESELFNHSMGSQIRLHEGVLHYGGQPEPSSTATVPGMDVSSYQGTVDWTTAYKNGARWAYVKATEGTYYINSDFAQQYNGSYSAGMIRGAYHFANPADSSGSSQAQYFVANGGGWSADGKTLPGALDMEWDPYGSDCYGLSQSAMASWVDDFVTTYHSLTRRYPAIYTSQSWWSECLGSTLNIASTDPLWVARYSTSAGTLPYPWTRYVFWQFADSGVFPGDEDVYNGTLTGLKILAKW